ncbi:hypothetical protein BE08_01505 [Sorangium cellulosum]|uniref:Uncharacterized protein n=1 Tax=Sorangium cellulosum TaxID=56 RepID=A0A150PTZ9_SORCE|nr:hypothetical protein BE08_01505 [Sorangium cellulosum]
MSARDGCAARKRRDRCCCGGAARGRRDRADRAAAGWSDLEHGAYQEGSAHRRRTRSARRSGSAAPMPRGWIKRIDPRDRTIEPDLELLRSQLPARRSHLGALAGHGRYP